MADRAISALPTATTLTASDLFVLSQGNQAKNTTWQTIIGYLTTALDGHGGIQSIAKTSTSGLVDTYTLTLADETTYTFTVTNGDAVSTITQYYAVSTSDSTAPETWYTTLQTMTPTYKYLWSYMHYVFDSGDTLDSTAAVIGVYGDTGQAWYVHIKYSSQQPTSDSDMGDIPDNWIGIYSGTSSTAPTHYTDYDWFEFKGEKGDTGDASAITSQSVDYMESTSGTVVPSGSWTPTIPSVTQGNFLWTRTILNFNDGSTVTSYSVSRYGVDGLGSVVSVNSIGPDGTGNVSIVADNIPTDDNTSVQARIDGLEDIAGDGVLSGFTATDLTGAANELKTSLNSVETDITQLGIDLLLLKNLAKTVSAVDYNTIDELTYNVGVGANCPTANGYMLVFPLRILSVGNTLTVAQFAFDLYHAGSVVYYRTAVANVWGNWKKLGNETITTVSNITKGAKIGTYSVNCYTTGKVCVLSYYFVTTSEMARNDVIATLPSSVWAAAVFWNAKSSGTYRVAVRENTLVADETIPNGTTCQGQITFIIN